MRYWQNANMQERRRSPRIHICRAAKVIASEPRVYDCLVRDISALGARLEFSNAAAIPDVFELTFDAARTIRVCRVAWRTETQIGVEFRESSTRRAA